MSHSLSSGEKTVQSDKNELNRTIEINEEEEQAEVESLKHQDDQL